MKKEYNFSGKTVVITGGATGIGFVAARTFCRLGANVAICGRRDEILKQAEDELISAGDANSASFLTVPCDMSIEEDAFSLVKKVSDKFGGIGVFVNNSGVWSLLPITAMSAANIDYAFNNTLKSAILGTKAAAESMSGGGVIINIGSFAGIMAQKGAGLYACLKAAVVSFTKSAAAELAERNIRVNCITPGVIRTPMTDEYINENYQRLIQPIALQRVGECEEIADGIVFLASDYSSYITGENLCITGGKYLTQL